MLGGLATRSLLRSRALGPISASALASASRAAALATLRTRTPPLARPASQAAQALAERMRSAAGRPASVGGPKLPASHKPPKRRLEAISAPLRNNPAPTRGPILQCIAHTTAERYDLMALAGVLRHLGVRWDEVPEGDQDRAFVIGPWKGRGGAERLIRGREVRRTAAVVPGEEETPVAEEDLGFEYGERGEIWVFNSGSFVTWGLSEEEGRAFLRDVVRHKGARVEGDRLTADEYEVEEVDFVVDPMAQTAVLGNLILLGRPPSLSTFPPSPSLGSLLARYTLSLALARSSALSVLEDRLDSHIASVSLLPRALERFGAQPMGRREVIRKIGELMVLRMAVNTRGGGLEETPEFFWSEPALEDYFDTVAKEFEIKERVDLLNKKIDYAQEIQNTLRALLTEASGHRMELIIIVLIAVEVVFVLVREGPELWQHFAYPVIQALHGLIRPNTNGDGSAPQRPAPRPYVGAPTPPPQEEPVVAEQPRLV